MNRGLKDASTLLCVGNTSYNDDFLQDYGIRVPRRMKQKTGNRQKADCAKPTSYDSKNQLSLSLVSSIWVEYLCIYRVAVKELKLSYNNMDIQ